MAARLKLSVVIPVGPGDRAWTGLLRDLAALEADAEIILVAPTGATPPGFAARAYRLQVPARWLEAPAGRARQQNAGARAAAGDALWFLHADSRVPAPSLDAALRFARENALGYFRLRYLDDGPWAARLNGFGAGVRSRWVGLPFGDQGFLLSRSTFARLGGFDESLPAGEDHALVWTARVAGIALVDLGQPVHSSARRYREQGWLRTTLRHAGLTLSQARRFRAMALRKRGGG
jgi:GT2 family glycosyltransferase